MEPIEDDVRARIIACRESLNLSQNKAAKLCGMSQSSYWNIESGRSKITLEALAQIAAGFGTSVADLMGFQTSETEYVLPPEAVDELAKRIGQQVRRDMEDSLDQRLPPKRGTSQYQIGQGDQEED